MKIWAIYDSDSELYISRRTPHRLIELGPDIAMYSCQSDAMRAIESKLGHDIDYTSLQIELAWDLLEKVYEKDRWHIDCSYSELQDAISQFKNLKAIPLCLEEVL